MKFSHPGSGSRRNNSKGRHAFEFCENLESRTLFSSAVSKSTPKSTAINIAAIPAPAIDVLQSVAKLSKAAAKTVSAAYGGLFSSVTALGKAVNGASQHIESKSVTPFTLDLSGLQTALAKAPTEFTKAASKSPLTLAIPEPDGTFDRFSIVTTQVMAPALAKQFPSIRTYRGIGIDDPTESIRLDTTSLGFHVQVISPGKTFYIDPYYLNDAKGTYASYYKADAINTAPWTCYTKDTGVIDAASVLEDPSTPLVSPLTTYSSPLRVYRAAVAADHQYVAAVGGGTVTGGESAVVTAMNRVDGVYESELDIRLVLVANNSSLIYASATGDPYSNSTNDINVNTGNINSVIGSANYDIGHVFTTGSGGIAQLGCVGGSSKGAGTTGTPSPIGDAFTIDYVAHEMGHQFNANHTFNTASDSNRSAAHAYEPGSGTTIMAYAGIEGTDDLQPHSDPYFHSDSIDAIHSFITSNIPNVGTQIVTGNTAPTVSSGLNYVIPANTPFALTATGSDADGDTVTYDWQERDLGAALNLNSADNGSSPLFKDYPPSTNPTRTFPILSSVLAGRTTSAARYGDPYEAERLPTVARAAMKFRVIARDNKLGGGGVSTADMQLQVVNTGAAFAVTGLDTAGTSYLNGSSQTVTWNVAGTSANGINAANVKISLSTDGGITFPTVLLASTANNGSASVTIPATITTSTARIKIEAIGNVFFDISNANFAITPSVIYNGTWTAHGDGVTWTDPNNWSNNTVPTASDDVTINVANNPTINVSGAQSVKSVVTSVPLNITGSLSVASDSTFNAAVTVSGVLTGNGSRVFNSPLTFTGALSGSGAITVKSTASWNSGGTVSGGAAMTIGSSGSLTINAPGASLIDRNLTVQGKLSMATGGDKLLQLNVFTIASTGSIDLTDNDLLVSAAYESPSVVQAYIVSARDGGLWDKSGITTSLPTTLLVPTGLGLLTGAEFNSVTAGNTLFDGQVFQTNDTLVKYTYNGDANFDGKVNANDYGLIDSGYQNQQTAGFTADWYNGDFNFDGTINANDYALIDTAYQLQGGTL